MKPRAKWIDQTILTSHVYIGLCVTQEQLEYEYKRLCCGGTCEFAKPGCGNAVELIGKNGANCNIVSVNLSESSMTDIVGVIAHEAVHVYQNIMDYIGEKSPGAEIEAYIIEKITRNLFDAYQEMTKPKQPVACGEIRTPVPCGASDDAASYTAPTG